MISKEKFIEYINKLKKYEDYIDEINQVNRKYKTESEWFCDYKLLDIVVELLKEIFNDCEDGGWLEYFIFELEYGEKYKDGSITIDGKNIELKTPEDLYDLLIRLKEL